MIENYTVNLLTYNCEDFQASTTINITKKQYESLPFQNCMIIEDDEIPGLHHQYRRKGVIHNLNIIVYPVKKSKYRFVIKYSLSKKIDAIACQESKKDINKFISSILDFNIKYTFNFIGKFEYPKKEYFIEIIESNVSHNSVESKKRLLPQLSLSGLRYKGSGPVKSIIVDTYPEEYSYFTISGANEIMYSADNIIKRLKFFSRISNGFVTKK